jgi:hypothetical protein
MTRVVPARAALLLLLVLGCQPGEIDPALANMTQTCNAPAIFTKYSCSNAGCHDATGTAAGFSMTTTGWERCLIGDSPSDQVKSMCLTNGPYLMAGVTPAQGLFLKKISTSPGCGVRMPQVAPMGYMNSAELACVQMWADSLIAMGPGTNCGGGARDGGGQ